MHILFLIFSIGVVFSALLFLVFLLSVTVIGHYFGAPFIRSDKKKIKTMLDLAEIKPDNVVVDLGSGDGSLVIEAAKQGARAVGIEINPFLVWYSQWRARRLGVHNNASFMRKNFRRYPLKEADVVFLYLWPSTIEELKHKLAHELKPGARIISNSFPIPEWTAIMKRDNTYLYEMTSSIGE